MKLGLGLNIKTLVGTTFAGIDSLSSLSLWLKFNTGQRTADLNRDGEDDIEWSDQSSNDNDATNTNEETQGSFNAGSWTIKTF